MSDAHQQRLDPDMLVSVQAAARALSTGRFVPYWPQVVVVGNRCYTTCLNCAKVVKIDKWLFGSLHVCR